MEVSRIESCSISDCSFSRSFQEYSRFFLSQEQDSHMPFSYNSEGVTAVYVYAAYHSPNQYGWYGKKLRLHLCIRHSEQMLEDSIRMIELEVKEYEQFARLESREILLHERGSGVFRIQPVDRARLDQNQKA